MEMPGESSLTTRERQGCGILVPRPAGGERFINNLVYAPKSKETHTHSYALTVNWVKNETHDIWRWIYNPAHTVSCRRPHRPQRSILMGFRDWPGVQTIGRMAGTGTAVGGMGTNEVGCQLRWRFFGGPEFIADDTKHQKQMQTTVSKANNPDIESTTCFCRYVSLLSKGGSRAYLDCLLSQLYDTPDPEVLRRLGKGSVREDAHQHQDH